MFTVHIQAQEGSSTGLAYLSERQIFPATAASSRHLAQVSISSRCTAQIRSGIDVRPVFSPTSPRIEGSTLGSFGSFPAGGGGCQPGRR